MKITFYLSFILFISGFNCFCQEKSTIEKWCVNDISIVCKNKVSNPHEIIFGAVFINKNGEKLKVPGFYNDNSTWVVRFCPSLEGEWTYSTYSSIPQLAGRSGVFQVTPTTNKNEHGPVCISKTNPQRFQYSDGSPYFSMAYELDWLFALDFDNKNDIPKTREIISQVKQNKFNQIVMNVYAYDALWGEREKVKPEHSFAKPNFFPYKGTNDAPDYSSLNIDFFKHLDRVIAHLNSENIVSHLMIYVWNKKVNWPKPESCDDNLYFDYVVKRYQAYPNLIWDISKEALAYGHDDMNYITRRIDRLKTLDGYNRLLSVHDYSYCSAFPGKVDFISVQEWRPNLYNEMKLAVTTFPEKPVFNIEHGGYEKTSHSIFNGAYTDADVCLDRNYQCAFAGVYSTYYWQNTSWYEVVYNPTTLEGNQKPKFEYLKHFVQLFQDYDFAKLEPTQYFFSPYCLTDNKTVYLFYLPPGMTALEGNLPSIKGEKVNLKWFDAFTGQYLDEEIKDFTTKSWIGIKKSKMITSPMTVAILEVIQ